MTKISVESIGRRDFYELRDELLAAGRRFDESTLTQVPYRHLTLCGTGSAGTAACALRLVREEKVQRRQRFLALEEHEWQEVERHLLLEGMLEDVRRELALKDAPRWAELSFNVQAWAKLVCLFNHVSSVHSRMGEILNLIRRSAGEGNLPHDVAMRQMQKLKTVAWLYPVRVTDAVLRQKLHEVAEEILNHFPAEDRMIAERELIADYSCTSDCFRLVV